MGEFKKIRVIIVDDSFFTRKLLREVLSSDPEIEIVGEARNGVEAFEEALRLKPDVITMDYMMPEMNGIEATELILSKVKPQPAILMISAYTKTGLEETLESLRAGAVDFITKPSGEISMDLKKIKKEILLKIKAAASARIIRYPKISRKNFTSGDGENHKNTVLKIVLVGASTGGPPVLENLFSEFPVHLYAAFLVVQHMPRTFTKILAERLNKTSMLHVKEAEDGEIIKAGTVLVAPGDFHMEIIKADKIYLPMIHLTQKPLQHGLRPAIDITMISASKVYKKRVIGVILTGMGEDGKKGMEAIRNEGGYTIAQDPQTAVLDSMPRAVIESNLADEILSPEQIAKRIIQLTS